MWWGLLGEISITVPPRALAMGPYSRSASMMMISSSVPMATLEIVPFMPMDLPEPDTPRTKAWGEMRRLRSQIRGFLETALTP